MNEVDTHSSLRLSFANKGIGVIKICNIFHHISMRYRIPAYFKDQSVTKIFNYKSVLQDLNIYDFNYKPSDCVSVSSLFIYNSAGQVITDEFYIINKYYCC